MTRPFGQIEGFVGLQQGPAGLPRRARPQISAAQPLSAGSHPRQAQSHLRAPAATTLEQLSPKQRESLLSSHVPGSPPAVPLRETVAVKDRLGSVSVVVRCSERVFFSCRASILPRPESRSKDRLWICRIRCLPAGADCFDS